MRTGTGFGHRRPEPRPSWGRVSGASNSRRSRRTGWLAAGAMMLAMGSLAAAAPVATAFATGRVPPRELGHTAGEHGSAKSSKTVWLCRPGAHEDPCARSLTTTVVGPSGSSSILTAKIATTSKFDCFYVYPTVSSETKPNADFRVQAAEIAATFAQASRFSTVCRVWAPLYRQITLTRLFASPLLNASSQPTVTAYDSLRAAFEDYLRYDNDGRPIIFIGHSQGATMLIRLIQHFIDHNPALRKRLVLAILLGGNVVVPTGALVGGSFTSIPACSSPGEAGCVIAYSTFAQKPPADSFFGRPGQGVSILAGQTAKRGLQVVCVNPVAIGGGSGAFAPFFPSEGKLPTPWVEFPQLYSARCESVGGATWLQVTKVSGASDPRPVVTESDGPAWGYHDYDVNLALGNLVADTAAAEATWSRSAHH